MFYERSEERKELDRRRRGEIERCASCHRDIYEQWQKDPHGKAYANVVRIIKKNIGSTKGFSERRKKKLVKKHYKSVCIGCHSPMLRVFEDGVSPLWDGTGTPKLRIFAKRQWLTQTNGVDCIVCHAYQDRVVTRADYKPPEGFVPPEGFCNPLPSKTFSHIYKCDACHFILVDNYRKNYHPDPRRQKAPFFDCETCHSARGADGKRLHRYYWAEEPEKIEFMLQAAFEGIGLSVGRADGKKRLALEWNTDFVPHELIPDTPKVYILRTQLLGDDGAEVFSVDVRFYHRNRACGRTPGTVRPTNQKGEMIHLKAREHFKRGFELPDSVGDSGTIRLTVLKKPQFGMWDRDAVKLYEREQRFDLRDAAANSRSEPCANPNDASDEMVAVGDMCVDKYEASAWSKPAGGKRYGITSDDYPCGDNGQDCSENNTRIYARSVSGVAPSRYLTWFQAAAACENAGKRLLSNAEWQAAARGTPDPGKGAEFPACNVNTHSPSPSVTGGNTGCRSSSGAENMLGSLYEWIGDWYLAGQHYRGAPTKWTDGTRSTSHWPDKTYGGDGSWNVAGRSYSRKDTGATGLPAAAGRGGCWDDGAAAGVFAFDADYGPSFSDYDVGFRCGRHPWK